MKEALGLEQQQRLQQRLSASQVQFVRLLEMSTPELEEEIHRVVDENPALEVVDAYTTPSEEAGEDAGYDQRFNETSEELQRADYGSDDDIPFNRYSASNHSADDSTWSPIEIAQEDIDLGQSLIGQLADQNLSDADRALAEYVIGEIDDNGYLSRTAEQMSMDVAINMGIDVSAAQIERAIRIAQSLDPAGIAAYDLQECLLLQMRRDERPMDSVVRDAAIRVIAQHFELFTHKHYDKMRHALGVDLTTLEAVLNYIKSFDPKPGARTLSVGSDDLARQITPDVVIEPIDESNTAYSVSVNSRIPDLAIEETFIPDPSRAVTTSGRQAYEFVKQRYDEAREFISRINRRGETLIAVMKAIVTLQSRFFETYDKADLKPMVLRDIEALTGYDLSVISRATSGKYVSTPVGVFSIKSFFSEAPTDDSDTSTHAITAEIEALIKAENPKRPLSDQAIEKALRDKGYDIARRTVAKYRERMKIPVARLRKKI